MIDVKVPSVGESIQEVTIARWLKKNGELVKADEPICEVESEKATVELPAPQAGILHIKVAEATTVAIGAVVASIDPKGSAAKIEVIEVKSSAQASSAVEKKVEASGDKNYPSPAAGKILAEKKIEPQDVSGTGRDGRITKEDALKAMPPVALKKSLELVEANTNASSSTRDSRKQPMTALRKTIAKRLVAAKNNTAMLTTFNEVDMSAIMNVRKKYKDLFKEKHEINLGFMSFFAKAVCLALKEWPAVNAQIDDQDIVYHDYCDIGVAVSTPKGLVVPVIKNAELMSLAEIEKAISELALKARDSKLTIDEMKGGTFTITNGGVFGSMLSTPILNAPQSAILGMHNIVDRPVAINGEVHIRPIMYLALSYDHRIIDGRESVSFLKKVKEYLEDPTRLLLGV